MRAEDKRIGPNKDEAEVEQRKRQDRAHDTEKRLEGYDDRTTRDPTVEAEKAERCTAMMRVIEAIFRKDLRPLDGLTGFSAAEMKALRYFEAAVKGRDVKSSQLVYAEDREDLLEQALAVLYPTLSHGMEDSALQLREQHDDLVDRVTLLREEIASKEDAQEDVIEARQRVLEADKADDDKDDDDAGDGEGDKDGDGDGDAKPKPATDADEDDAAAGDVGDGGMVVP